MYPQSSGSSLNATVAQGLAVPKRDTELDREVSRLHRAVDALLSRASSLEVQLAPILYSDALQTTETPDEPVSTPIGKQLRDASKKIEIAVRALTGVSDRLAI